MLCIINRSRPFNRYIALIALFSVTSIWARQENA
jgi:hypothetical protein